MWISLYKNYGLSIKLTKGRYSSILNPHILFCKKHHWGYGLTLPPEWWEPYGFKRWWKMSYDKFVKNTSKAWVDYARKLGVLEKNDGIVYLVIEIDYLRGENNVRERILEVISGEDEAFKYIEELPQKWKVRYRIDERCVDLYKYFT